MSAGHISQLTDDVLEEFFEPDQLARARMLAVTGAAVIVARHAGSVQGRVRAGYSSYWAAISWELYGGFFDIYDRCSCPVGGSCEHTVALIFAERGSMGRRAAAGSWRSALAPVAQLADQPPATRPLALRFTVIVPPQRPWDTDYVPSAQLEVRPLTTGKKGNWIRTGVSWRDLAHPGSAKAEAFDPAQWQALAVSAAQVPGTSYHQGSAGVSLADLGPSVWLNLELAQQAGVELLDEYDRSGRVVVEDAPARFALDLSRTENGGLELAAAIATGDLPQRLPAKQAGLIGEHGAFWLDDSGVLHLAKFSSPLPRELSALAVRRPVTIPASDVEEFRTTTGVRLAQVTSVSAEDPSIAPKIPDPPRLVVHIGLAGQAEARLTWGFQYGEAPPEPLLFAVGRVRDYEAERRLVHDLRLTEVPVLLDELCDRRGLPLDATVRGADLIDLMSTAVPWLLQRGVGVRVADEFPELREATADPVISIRVDDDPGTVDWYDLGVAVSIEGEEIAFAALFTALAQNQEKLLLPSGTWLRLDRPDFDQLRRLIDEARGLDDSDGDPSRLRINRFQSEWWDEFAKLGVIESQSRRWSQAMATMRSVTTADPVAVPDGIHATLRPYQLDGLAWLAWLHRHDLGGILADDMGLGKTLQALALFAHVREVKPQARFLVVAPTSVVGNWQRETERFAPELGVVGVSQTRARRGASVAEVAGDAAVMVTSYTLLRLELEQYQELDWEIVVLDEAQFVKNRQSKLYQCVRRVDAASKIAMTGTPLENSLMDLWSLLSITAPGLYPDPERFADVYRKPIENGSAPELLGTLRRRIAPLMRRRTKEQVVTELPPKTEQEMTIELGDKHQALYNRWLQRERQKVLGLIGDMDSNRFQIFRSLTLLRQLALDPALVSDEHARVGSAKLDQLVEQLVEVALEGHRALVFSQFTRFLARVKARLDEAGIAYAYLDGKTRNRAKVIDGFKDGDAPVFLISLKSGGFGLNLTEADYCFVLDPWWNPATEAQAIDRTHRIGQDKPVMVYRYVSAGTIEEKVMQLKARKQAIFDGVIGDDEGALSGALTADDIRGLLGVTVPVPCPSPAPEPDEGLLRLSKAGASR